MSHYVSMASRAVYERKTIAELERLLTSIEESGIKLKNSMNTKVNKRVVATGLVDGKFVDITEGERTMNALRESWKDVRSILNEKLFRRETIALTS